MTNITSFAKQITKLEFQNLKNFGSSIKYEEPKLEVIKQHTSNQSMHTHSNVKYIRCVI